MFEKLFREAQKHAYREKEDKELSVIYSKESGCARLDIACGQFNEGTESFYEVNELVSIKLTREQARQLALHILAATD